MPWSYEEVKGIQDTVVEDGEDYDSYQYEPTIGLIPGVNFDPETGEIFDDSIIDEWREAIENPDSDIDK